MKPRITNAALALVLALALPFATGCSTGSQEPEPQAEAVEKEEDVVIQEDDQPFDETEGDEPPAEDEQDDAAVQRVGEKGMGFVTIPASWVEFKDVDGNTSLQWCDGTPYTIISLNIFDLSGLDEDVRESFTLEDAANSVWANILDDGAEEDSVQGARVQLAGREALQVYSIFPDGSYLVCWVVEDDEGTIRYVAAEGTEDTIMDAFGYVQDTYEL